MKNKTNIKHVLRAMIIPLATIGISEIISLVVCHERLFSSAFDVYAILTNSAVSVIAAFALSLNMSTGRMDLSLGGQQLVGVIIGGNIGLKLGLGAFGIIGFSMLFGMITGLISGLIFTILRIDAFVLGLGLALVYEGASIYYSVNGLELFDSSITSILSNQYFVLGVGIFVSIIMYFLMNNTIFGYNYQCIQGSQNLAINAGIKVKKNCIICYAISGALIALAGSLSAGINGVLTPSINLSSVSIVFSGFLPVMLAYYLKSFVPLEIGIPFGSITCKTITVLLGKLNISASYSTIFLMSTIFMIIIILNATKEIALTKQYKVRSLED